MIVGMVVLSGCTIPLAPFGRLPVEGTLLDAETREPVAGATIIVRALCCGMQIERLEELGRGAARASDGGFLALVPVPAGSRTDHIEVAVTRDGCETVFLFDVDQDITFVDQGLVIRNVFRITDPILVPACAVNGDGPP